MKRRTFLEGGLAGAAGIVLGCGGNEEDAPPVVADGDGFVRDRPLPGFARLQNQSSDSSVFSASLSAAAGEAQLIHGAATRMLLYNGSIPGPLVEVREGQRVRIEFDNRLPYETTIHWHGLPIPADQDGNPMDPVPAGSIRVYDYVLPKGSAGTYWYHPASTQRYR